MVLIVKPYSLSSLSLRVYSPLHFEFVGVGVDDEDAAMATIPPIELHTLEVVEVLELVCGDVARLFDGAGRAEAAGHLHIQIPK
jgi:hypothetical protein